jgi:hypothetical protein
MESLNGRMRNYTCIKININNSRGYGFKRSVDKLITISQGKMLHDPDTFEVPVHQGP